MFLLERHSFPLAFVNTLVPTHFIAKKRLALFQRNLCMLMQNILNSSIYFWANLSITYLLTHLIFNCHAVFFMLFTMIGILCFLPPLSLLPFSFLPTSLRFTSPFFRNSPLLYFLYLSLYSLFPFLLYLLVLSLHILSLTY